VAFEAPSALPAVGKDAELALYRALQEGLANAVRHGECRNVAVTLRADTNGIELEVADDGVGLPTDDPRGLNRARGGLAGIRERIGSVGGTFTLDNRTEGGARVLVRVPIGPISEGNEGEAT
jgi:two-component system sensor histidine kinase UhpB